MSETTTETATKAPEAGTENPAPVICDGDGAGAISWAETRAAMDATKRTMERAAAKLNWAIVVFCWARKRLNRRLGFAKI
ncbi:unnamed protein product [Linum trigynum]|uniref:Uncharacterized protein n=1 Tax=Linum trigynum TaxID=586398 RepID=A0AAV2EH27_9ROSI